MYVTDIKRKKMLATFGKHANVLMRNGLTSIEDVKEYIEKYPFDEYKKYHALYYRNIGPTRYEQILEILNNVEKTLS